MNKNSFVFTLKKQLLFSTVEGMKKKLANFNFFQIIFPDLVAYSSTVIPLKSYEVSYNIGGKIDNEEYKEAYLKHLHKKVKHQDESPDTLITRKCIYIRVYI